MVGMEQNRTPGISMPLSSVQPLDRLAHALPQVLLTDEFLVILRQVIPEPDLAPCDIQGGVGSSGDHPERGKDGNQRHDDQKNIAGNS